MCANKDIQELLPSYLEQALGQEDRPLVERHLTDCGDCRAELDLLGILAAEPVPDPGEAFWAALPGKVHRQVRKERERSRPWWDLPVPVSISLPRWAWAGAAAAALLVAAVSWFLVHPAPVEIASTAPPDTLSPYEDMLDAESVDMAGLDDTHSW